MTFPIPNVSTDLTGQVALVTGAASGLGVTMPRDGYFNGETVRLDGAIRMPPR